MTAPAQSTESRSNLLNMLPGEADALLRAFAMRNGEPAYRAAQVLQHLWQQPKESFGEMTQLPKELRDLLEAEFEIPRLGLSARQLSTDGTEKFLFRLADGEHIETVAIPEGQRLTLRVLQPARRSLAARRRLCRRSLANRGLGAAQPGPGVPGDRAEDGACGSPQFTPRRVTTTGSVRRMSRRSVHSDQFATYR